jgi:hypothetical protein
VTVGAECDLDDAVTEPLHNGSGVGSFGDEHGGVAGAEVVEPGGFREAGPDYGRFEVSGVEVRVPQWATSR